MSLRRQPTLSERRSKSIYRKEVANSTAEDPQTIAENPALERIEEIDTIDNDLTRYGEWPNYGQARFNAKHHLIYDCRERPGLRYYFKICAKKERRGLDGYIYWKCLSCDRLKQNRRRGTETTDQRQVPKIALKDGLIYTDPEYPKEPHFCDPVSTSFVQRMTPQKLREKEDQLRHPFQGNLYVAGVDRAVERMIAVTRGQAKVRLFSKEGLIGPHPIHIHCPRCGMLITTVIRMRPGRCSWIGCGSCVLACCWLGCCLFPFRMNTCQDVAHHCPLCRFPIGKYRRGGNYSKPYPYVPSESESDSGDSESDQGSKQNLVDGESKEGQTDGLETAKVGMGKETDESKGQKVEIKKRRIWWKKRVAVADTNDQK